MTEAEYKGYIIEKLHKEQERVKDLSQRLEVSKFWIGLYEKELLNMKIEEGFRNDLQNK